MIIPVRTEMPGAAVMMTLCVADQVMQLRKGASLRDLRSPARRLSFMAMLPLLVLGACAETQAPSTIVAAPSSVSIPAPTPTCQAPPGSQADKRDPATAWQKAVDRLRAEDCSQALDPRPTPMRPEYSRNPRQENLDRRSLDPVPNRSFSSTNQGAVFRYHLPFSQ